MWYNILLEGDIVLYDITPQRHASIAMWSSGQSQFAHQQAVDASEAEHAANDSVAAELFKPSTPLKTPQNLSKPLKTPQNPSTAEDEEEEEEAKRDHDSDATRIVPLALLRPLPQPKLELDEYLKGQGT